MRSSPSSSSPRSLQNTLEFDRHHVWHPYASMPEPDVLPCVRSATGVRLHLEDGRSLIDGMSSWWSAIHGYNHPVLNQAVHRQLEDMAHVMFGGLTHRPAVELCDRLLRLTPTTLDRVFLCDSGSVSVEVAMKMALQFAAATDKPQRTRFLTLRGGYHGDTFGAMSVCDPVTGMHRVHGDALVKQFFVERPNGPPDRIATDADMAPMHEALATHHTRLAGVIVEPIVQAAGGMHFYSSDYLRRLRSLCDDFDVPLIFDEIATGFGRTGRFLALEHADVTPDILCVGKALTGGYMTLAATLATERIGAGIARGAPGVLLHGPTFMANPLACSVATASIDLLLSTPWQRRVAAIESQLRAELAPCSQLARVADVRVFGAIGVVELREPVDPRRLQAAIVGQGVWLRPFGKLLYTMPPYVISETDLRQVTGAMNAVVREI